MVGFVSLYFFFFILSGSQFDVYASCKSAKNGIGGGGVGYLTFNFRSILTN